MKKLIVSLIAFSKELSNKKFIIMIIIWSVEVKQTPITKSQITKKEATIQKFMKS